MDYRCPESSFQKEYYRLQEFYDDYISKTNLKFSFRNKIPRQGVYHIFG